MRTEATAKVMKAKAAAGTRDSDKAREATTREAGRTGALPLTMADHKPSIAGNRARVDIGTKTKIMVSPKTRLALTSPASKTETIRVHKGTLSASTRAAIPEAGAKVAMVNPTTGTKARVLTGQSNRGINKAFLHGVHPIAEGITAGRVWVTRTSREAMDSAPGIAEQALLLPLPTALKIKIDIPARGIRTETTAI